MKRLFILVNLVFFGLSLGLAQSGEIIDDIYITPNEASMVKEARKARTVKQKTPSLPHSTIYRDGAREIVFIDEYGNRTTVLADTLYVIDGELIADTMVVDTVEIDEEGYYLNGFRGSQSDYEYAERIRRFHNPRFTITIADPGYNDIFFLDNNYWNVYIDGIYATITPTWTNPYWWNYQYSTFSYNSWAWRYNWGYPYYSGWGLGSYYHWGYPYYGGWYGGLYDYYSPWSSWYYGYYGPGSYYGWGYPYYGGYYGYGSYYPYYYGGYYPYYGGAWYNTTNQTSRRSSAGTRTIVDSSRETRRSAVVNSGSRSTSARSNATRVSRYPSGTTSGQTQSSAVGTRGTRSSYSSDVDTRMRTGAVRTSQEWRNVRENNARTYSTPASSGRSSSVINRTNPSTSRSAGATSSSTRSSTRSSYENADRSSRSAGYGTSSSRSSYQMNTRSYDSSSSSTRSSGSYSSGSSSSSRSSGGSYSGGGSSSSGGGSRSSGGGGRR